MSVVLKQLVKEVMGDKEARARLMSRLSFVGDVPMVKTLYRLNTGKRLNLERPRTFNEKIQWYKLHYRNPMMTRCADKLLAKEYVREKGFGSIVTPVYAVWETAREMDFSQLPSRCILKCNHNSDGAVVWDREKMGEVEDIRKRFELMLGNNAFWGSREWCYRDIVPKVFAEELLVPRAGGLIDWNVFCFQGIPKLVLCNAGLMNDDGSHAEVARRAAFDAGFNYLDIETSMMRIPEGWISKPLFFEEMLHIASALSAPFPHVRVDFFQVDDQMRFGEMTFYSSSGYAEWKPEEWQYRMGDWFELFKYEQSRSCID
ncbi:hypothetical protein BN3658_01141 [Coriobacteriaceae bacterium CHKCI002]|nr:hypothetical protein BN3658_01141 [Coriobacteriaceae bacterium CHKCI002]